MPHALADAGIYLAVPVVASVLAGLIATWWSPKRAVRGYVQHFAAGIVLAAVALEVFPEVLEKGRRWGVVAGFAAGGAAMTALKWWFESYESRHEGSSVGLLSTAAIDTFVDGLVIGIGFALATEAGIVLSMALAVELFFVGLSVAQASLGGERSESAVTRWARKSWWPLAVTSALGALLMLGAGLGLSVLARLSQTALADLMAFGAAALLYLVVEELLVEAHEDGESPLATAVLFIGFAVFLGVVGF